MKSNLAKKLLKEHTKSLSAGKVAVICGIPKGSMSKYLSDDYPNEMKAHQWLRSMIRLGAVTIRAGSIIIHSDMITEKVIRDAI